MPRVLPAVLMAAAAAFPAISQDWGQLTTISSTLGINANRLCLGEGTRSDIGCPTYAPFISPTSGWLGIGTANPLAPLHVLGSGHIAYFDLSVNASTANQILIRRARGTASIPTALQNNDSIGNYRFNGHDGTSFLNTVGLLASVDGAVTTGVVPGRLVVQIADSAGILRERVRINSSGNVGISTTNPNARLEVQGDISATNLRLSGNLHVSGSQTIDGVTFANGGVSATGTVTATSFSGDGSRLTGINASSDRITSGTTNVIANNNASISFTVAGTEQMVINSSGNIGIGTASPEQKVSIVGTGPGTASYLQVTNGASGQSATDGLLIGYGTDNNVEIKGQDANALKFSTNSAERVRINSSGNVGMGTATPLGRLHVYSGASGLSAANSSADDLVIEHNNHGGLSILNPNNASGRIYFGDPQDDDVGRIIYNHSSNMLGFGTNGIQDRVVIDSAGNIGVGTTSPEKTLDVSGTAQIVSRTLIGGTGTPSATFQVSGSLLLAGNDNIPCTDSVLGLVRRNPTTGRLQACR